MGKIFTVRRGRLQRDAEMGCPTFMIFLLHATGSAEMSEMPKLDFFAIRCAGWPVLVRSN
jgi:hypothetical protein